MKIVCTHTHLHKEYKVIFHKNAFIYHTLPGVMEHIPSWEPRSPSSRNPEVHYRVYENPTAPYPEIGKFSPPSKNILFTVLVNIYPTSM